MISFKTVDVSYFFRVYVFEENPESKNFNPNLDWSSVHLTLT